MKKNTKQSIIALLLTGLMSIPFAFAANEPENVNNLNVTSKNATTLSLTWDASKDYQGNDVDHYRIYYSEKSVKNGNAPSYDVEVDTPDSNTNYELGGLKSDTSYYLAVTAIDAANVESLEYSMETSATPTNDGEETPQDPEEPTDLVAPTVTNIIALDKTHVLVGFSEEVKLPELLAEAAFTITEQVDPTKVLEIISAKQYTDDPEKKTIILETEEQGKDVNYIVTASVAITDLTGNPIVSGSTDSGLFLGSDQATKIGEKIEEANADANEEETDTNTEKDDPAEALLVEDVPLPDSDANDTTPPEDITNLVLSFTKQVEKFVISMNWTASINSAKDLVDQMLYMSMDRGTTYDEGSSLGASTTSHQVEDLEGGKEYTFKITTKDSNGNESVGMVKSIRLPQTGFGAGLLILMSVGLSHRALKRKKKKEIF